MSTSIGSIHYKLGLNTNEFDKKSKGVSSKLGGVGSKLVGLGKTTAKFGALAGGVIAGLAIKGGFDRALNIEDAQAKLKGLGHDTKSIDKIMGSALKSVKGTAFGLDAAATSAASAVAAGVEPGKELTRVLALTADTATITGRSFGEAGAVINKVLASNRLSMQEVNQLQDAGLPILSMLGKQYGKNAEEMREMVSAGEVDSEKFKDALEDNISGAALESGNTVRGAFANMKAALSRVGASLATNLMPKIKSALTGVMDWLSNNQEQIVAFAMSFVDAVSGIIEKIVEFGKKVAEYLGPKLEALFNTVKDDLMPVLADLWTVLQPLLQVIGVTLVVALGLAIDAINLMVSGLTWLWDQLKAGNPIIIALAGVFGTLAVAMAFNAIFNALTVGFNTLTLVTIPSVAAKIGWLKGIIATPMVMPALVIGAALASIMQIYRAVKAVMGAIDAMNEANRAQESTADQLYNNRIAMSKLAKNGTPEQRARARKYLDSGRYARGTNYARGGLSLVGEKGPELIDLPRGSKVYNNEESKQMSGGGRPMTINIGTINDKADADYLLRRINRDYQRVSLGVSAA